MFKKVLLIGSIVGLTACSSSLTSIDSRQVHFDFDKSEIRSEAKTELDKQRDYLSANPDQAIRIEGHTDSRGTSEYNMALGKKRAMSTKSYLIDGGVENNISTVSYGKERLSSLGTTESDHEENRKAVSIELK
ncbi:MAG: OmpA family protein [Alphaproteobacteria bacterium]|nr:OmpA family protein [Alphaproteobacteria bacterium]MBL0717916.1 OmpA family protein [Alphaproteobacteria bacterium]